MEFNKVLVANRGEIAIRVFRALTELGKKTVAIYSHEDRLALHRYKADEAYQLGEQGKPMSGYLDQHAIISLAKDIGVDAIHPGYGFLSENADFARLCAEHDIKFIGPSYRALQNLGDKTAARDLAEKANVATIPGSDGYIGSVEDAERCANEIGFPVMLKAAFGGGGRGMRVCQSASEVREAFEAATREAASSFGRGEVFIEKYLARARHIEIQLLSDEHGGACHLFERDCSIQRRNQKVVEVAPAIGLLEDLKNRMYSDAIRIGEAAGLTNAATAEFLVECDENMLAIDYFFIEVNPRIQVEHTVTELITGIDLVQSQIKIAEGKRLSELGIDSQDAIQMHGAAVQARVTTEDPRNGFAPDTGRILAYRSAAGFGIRLDPSVAGAGAEVTPYYDSLLVKVCAYAQNHEEAYRKLWRSLIEFRIRGVATNIPFIENILKHPTFIDGKAHTRFVADTDELFVFHRRRNRATRILRSIGDIIVNGPPGFDGPLTPPSIRIEPKVPERIESATDATVSFKSILDSSGPDAVAQAVRAHPKLLLTDTTFRDAHQSLLATRVRTTDIVAIAAATENRLSSLFSVECWGGATFDVAYRFLKEDPWERLRLIREAMPNTLLQMLYRGSNAVGYANYPENVIRDFVDEASREGIDVFRIFDCFNQLDQMKVAIEQVRRNDKIAEVCICFTGDPERSAPNKYTYDYYKRQAEAMADAGAHMIAIKDMAGLLKAEAAKHLMRHLREVTDLPIHVHTHDASGTGVTMLKEAAASGASIVDVALSSMSGLTSQPSLNALCAAMDGHPFRPEVDLDVVQPLADYWENMRTHYAPFETGLKSSSADVYRHEIPGGQYSNLKPQAMSVGLADQWDSVRERYREVNWAFGDITKVTPSSKVVGDMALWLVNNKMSMEDFISSDATYDVPKSVVDFMNGAIGFPEGGVPELTRNRILRGHEEHSLSTAELEPYSYEEAKNQIDKISTVETTRTLEISYALYPKVVKDYLVHRRKFGDTSVLPTWTFLYGMAQGEEVIVDIEAGKSLVIQYEGTGPLSEEGQRDVRFVLNGQPRTVRVKDGAAGADSLSVVLADPDNDKEVGAPMPGAVLDILVEKGQVVSAGDPLVILEAMKLETTVRASIDGTISEVVVKKGDKVPVEGMLLRIE